MGTPQHQQTRQLTTLTGQRVKIVGFTLRGRHPVLYLNVSDPASGGDGDIRLSPHDARRLSEMLDSAYDEWLGGTDTDGVGDDDAGSCSECGTDLIGTARGPFCPACELDHLHNVMDATTARLESHRDVINKHTEIFQSIADTNARLDQLERWASGMSRWAQLTKDSLDSDAAREGRARYPVPEPRAFTRATRGDDV